jgi:hypothetical protein
MRRPARRSGRSDRVEQLWLDTQCRDIGAAVTVERDRGRGVEQDLPRVMAGSRGGATVTGPDDSPRPKPVRIITMSDLDDLLTNRERLNDGLDRRSTPQLS